MFIRSPSPTFNTYTKTIVSHIIIYVIFVRILLQSQCVITCDVNNMWTVFFNLQIILLNIITLSKSIKYMYNKITDFPISVLREIYFIAGYLLRWIYVNRTYQLAFSWQSMKHDTITFPVFSLIIYELGIYLISNTVYISN